MKTTPEQREELRRIVRVMRGQIAGEPSLDRWESLLDDADEAAKCASDLILIRQHVRELRGAIAMVARSMQASGPGLLPFIETLRNIARSSIEMFPDLADRP